MPLLTNTVQSYLAYFVAFVMAVGAVANIVGVNAVREGYARWGYPPHFRFLTGLLETIAAGLILMEITRSVGLLLAGATMVAAVVTLLRSREYTHTPPAVIVLIAASLAVI